MTYGPSVRAGAGISSALDSLELISGAAGISSESDSLKLILIWPYYTPKLQMLQNWICGYRCNKTKLIPFVRWCLKVQISWKYGIKFQWLCLTRKMYLITCLYSTSACRVTHCKKLKIIEFRDTYRCCDGTSKVKKKFTFPGTIATLTISRHRRKTVSKNFGI